MFTSKRRTSPLSRLISSSRSRVDWLGWIAGKIESRSASGKACASSTVVSFGSATVGADKTTGTTSGSGKGEVDSGEGGIERCRETTSPGVGDGLAKSIGELDLDRSSSSKSMTFVNKFGDGELRKLKWK